LQIGDSRSAAVDTGIERSQLNGESRAKWMTTGLRMSGQRKSNMRESQHIDTSVIFVVVTTCFAIFFFVVARHPQRVSILSSLIVTEAAILFINIWNYVNDDNMNTFWYLLLIVCSISIALIYIKQQNVFELKRSMLNVFMEFVTCCSLLLLFRGLLRQF